MIYNNVLELIGNTPLVKYNDNICLKLEYFNPSSSIKDRAASSMLKEAMERGDINKETVIIEPTSGNTGIGLAMCCAVLGLRLIICMPESMSIERRKNIAAYGAELVLTPKERGMQGAVDKAAEIETAVEGREVVIAAGIGTGGTAFGLKEYLKNAIVFGVEPAESPLFTKGHAGPHAIQGIGANFIPKISEGKHLDGILTVKGEDAIAQARELAQKHGIFCGISAGANVCAAQELTKKYPDKLIVAIIPDSGERYLSVW